MAEPTDTGWHHNVTHRCERMGDHIHGPNPLPIPCDVCTSVEQLSREVPWREPYYFTEPHRPPSEVGLRIVPADAVVIPRSAIPDGLVERLDEAADYRERTIGARSPHAADLRAAARLLSGATEGDEG